MCFRHYFLIVVIFQLSLLIQGKTSDLYEAGGIECGDPPNLADVEVDMNWVMSTKTFYAPLMNKLDYLYQLSDLLRKEIDEIHASDWKAPNTCQEFNFKTTLFKGAGRKITFTIEPPDVDGGIKYKANWPDATPGKLYLHLTDNKNYLVTVGCWGGRVQSWNVLSPHRKLKAEHEKKILNYLKSIGFPTEEKFLVREEYSNCPHSSSDKKEL